MDRADLLRHIAMLKQDNHDLQVALRDLIGHLRVGLWGDDVIDGKAIIWLDAGAIERGLELLQSLQTTGRDKGAEFHGDK